MKKTRILILVGVYILLGCSHDPVRNPTSENPWASPDQFTDYVLYKNESYKFGSKQEEVREFLQQVQDVQKVQEAIQLNHNLGSGSSIPKRRVFHAKSHGCLIGKMEISTNRSDLGGNAERTRIGVFNPTNGSTDSLTGKTSYTVLVRYSNGVGVDRHDLVPDVKGMAMKIFGVKDAASGEKKNIDFNMTNSPTPFGTDQAEFVEFMKADLWQLSHSRELRADGYEVGSLPWFFLKHPRVARRLIAAGVPVSSVATQRYWAGHAYLLGSDMAMKLNVVPFQSTYKNASLEAVVNEMDSNYHSPKTLPEQMEKYGMFRDSNGSENPSSGLEKKLDANYLANDLADRAKTYPIKFTVNIQLEKEKGTPIEDNLFEWTEQASPSIPVATITFDRQDIRNTDLQNLCEQISFSPGHYVSQHRPLSNMGRGRIFTYMASALGRKAQQDISEEEVLQLKRKITNGY